MYTYRVLDREEQITINSYNATAEMWAREHNTASYWSSEVEIMETYLSPYRARVLEVGCGGGRDARLLIEAGYQYTGIDITPNFVRLAREQNPGGRFSQQSLYALAFSDDSFDGFWSSAVFLHLPKLKLALALGELKRVSRDGAVGYIAVKEGVGEGLTAERAENGEIIQKYWAMYSDKEMRDALEDCDMKVLWEAKRIASPRTTWLTYFVKSIK